MHLLVLGYSSISERRVIPAADKVSAISRISIASRSRPEPKIWPKRGRFFADYGTALAESGADLVYLSLPNSIHEEWALAALAAGKHVVVDKPALLSAEASSRAVAAARRRELLLTEASVFSYHPHFAALRTFFDEHGPVTHVNAQFIIPPLPKQNFRNDPKLGGGCLYDMGPYAAAVVRLLGGGVGEQLFCQIDGRRSEASVDTGFSVLARLANDAAFCGQFSFEGEYQNRLIVTGRFGSVLVERVFSPSADYSIAWQQRIRNVEGARKFEPADTFGGFLEAAIGAIRSGDHESFYRDLLADAEFRARLAQSLAV